MTGCPAPFTAVIATKRTAPTLNSGVSYTAHIIGPPSSEGSGVNYRDYMDDQTCRLVEQTRQQMIAGMIPEISQPTFDISKLARPQLGVMDQLNKQASEIAGTALLSNTRLEAQLDQQSKRFADAALQRFGHMGPSISEQIETSGTNVFDTYFGTGLGVIGRAREALKLINRPPTVFEALYGTKGSSSLFDTMGPTVSQMTARLADTDAWKGLGATPAYSVNENWRLANVGALANIDGVFGSLREAIDFEGSLKTSGLAQAVFFEARRLLDDQAARLAEAELTETANTGVDEALEADQNLSVVVDYIQRYFVVYLGYPPAQAHTLVRRIIWILLFSLSLYTHSQVKGQLNDTVEFGLGMVTLSAIGAVSTKGADTLIPDGKPDITD